MWRGCCELWGLNLSGPLETHVSRLPLHGLLPHSESSMPVLDHRPHLFERSLEATTIIHIEVFPGHRVWMRNVGAPFHIGIYLL